MARAPQMRGMISQVFSGQAMNFHNQDVDRARYQGPRGSGFFVEFMGKSGSAQVERFLDDSFKVITGSAVDAVVQTTDETKQGMRTYLDAAFSGSAMHANNHRRVSNAAVQSKYYDERQEKGQFTGLIYSKFGAGFGPEGFKDFLLLHLRGGVLKPKQSGWLRINASGNKTFGTSGQAGYYPFSKSSIFFAKSKDGNKLFLLRSYAKSSFSPLRGKTVLIATMVKFVMFTPRLGGLDAIAAARYPAFIKNFEALMAQRGSSSASAAA